MRKSTALFGMLLAGLLTAESSHAQTTRGNVDGVVGDGNGAVTLHGWACKVGETLPSARTVTLKLYVGGEAGSGGVELGTYTVDQPSEQAVNDICRNAYRYNRFTIGLSIAMRQQYGGQRLYVYADTFNPSARFQLLPGSGQPTVPQAPAVSDAVYYIHTDRLGSNVIMTDDKANVVAKSDYKAYGAASDNQPKNEAPGYTGHYEDPLTGLTYMQQRYYDSDLGRFVSVDPVAARSGDVFNFNRYAYANNSPLVFSDLTGMDACRPSTVVGGKEVFLPVQECGGGNAQFWQTPGQGGGGGSYGGGGGGGSSHALASVNVTADRPADPVVPIDAMRTTQSWYCTPGAASVAGSSAGGVVMGGLIAAMDLKGNPKGIAIGASLGGLSGGAVSYARNRMYPHTGDPAASTFSSMLGSAVIDREPGLFFINGAASYIGAQLGFQQSTIAQMLGRALPYTAGATLGTAPFIGKGALVAGPMIGLASGLTDYSVEAAWNSSCGN